MSAKFVVILSLAVAASAIPLDVTKLAYDEPEAPAHYEFEYSVHDSLTGDIKQQKEARNGDQVQGSYSLLQPDGLTRIVDYTSDKHTGFNAIVRYEGHPTPAPAPTKVLSYAAPAAKLAYAPVAKVSYAPAPAAKLAYAPVAKVSYAPAPAAKITYAAAPVAKVAYTEPLGHVTFSSPDISYHH